MTLEQSSVTVDDDGRPTGFPFVEHKEFGQSEVLGTIFPDGTVQYSSRRGGGSRTPTTYQEGRKYRLLFFTRMEHHEEQSSILRPRLFGCFFCGPSVPNTLSRTEDTS